MLLRLSLVIHKPENLRDIRFARRRSSEVADHRRATKNGASRGHTVLVLNAEAFMELCQNNLTVS
jgi:hypothetical protein